MSDFEYRTNVSYYLKLGWKLVSPQRAMCPVCGSALIQCVLYDFMFCVPCQKKVVFESNKLYILEQSQTQQPVQSDSQLALSQQTQQANNIENSIDQPQSQPQSQYEQQQHEQQQQIQEQNTQNTQNEQDNYQEEDEDETPRMLCSGWKMTARTCPTKNCYNPLMQKPNSNELVCGKCKFRGTTAQKMQEISLSVQPADLARQIVQRANARIEGRDPDEVCAVEKTSQQMEYEEMKRRQQEEEEYYQEQVRREQMQQMQQQGQQQVCQNNVENKQESQQIMDLKEKIHGLTEQLLEPCSFAEIEQFSKAIMQLNEVIKVLKQIE
ncbi:Conserved_hypothetical protein [Hexamita inflata]|uniref:Uncharacterized protein n=1 Tax=Hexamita inflata TaxID=28002 RepID=A0AA86R2U8_9EUKA|nr:Conserved hypothetical protein [Hexamita inflata]